MEHYTKERLEKIVSKLWNRQPSEYEIGLLYHGYELGVTMSNTINGDRYQTIRTKEEIRKKIEENLEETKVIYTDGAWISEGWVEALKWILGEDFQNEKED